MMKGNKIRSILYLLLTIAVQYIMAIVCVIIFPGLGFSFLKLVLPSHPITAYMSLLVAYTIGIYLTGLLGLILIRKGIKRWYLKRLFCLIIAAAIPLGIALIPGVGPDDPFYFVSILTGILGFYLPELLWNKST